MLTDTGYRAFARPGDIQGANIVMHHPVGEVLRSDWVLKVHDEARLIAFDAFADRQLGSAFRNAARDDQRAVGSAARSWPYAWGNRATRSRPTCTCPRSSRFRTFAP